MFSHRSNALLDEINRRGRARLAHKAVPSDNVRALPRALQRNAAICYAPVRVDPRGELLPFFGEPAMTSLAPSRLAQLSRAPVIPFSFRRSDEQGHYEIEFHEPVREVETRTAALAVPPILC
jgi:lauroyl/myristoyl acyltransferase